MMAAGTMTRVNHLLFAGITYHGASGVAVARIASSYAVFAPVALYVARPLPSRRRRRLAFLRGVDYKRARRRGRDRRPTAGRGGLDGRSEERRVGKEGRSRWSPYH